MVALEETILKSVIPTGRRAESEYRMSRRGAHGLSRLAAIRMRVAASKRGRRPELGRWQANCQLTRR